MVKLKFRYVPKLTKIILHSIEIIINFLLLHFNKMTNLIVGVPINNQRNRRRVNLYKQIKMIS